MRHAILEQVEGNLRRKVEVELRETKLEKRVAEFISLICNASMMEKKRKEIGLLSIPLLVQALI